MILQEPHSRVWDPPPLDLEEPPEQQRRACGDAIPDVIREANAQGQRPLGPPASPLPSVPGVR